MGDFSARAYGNIFRKWLLNALTRTYYIILRDSCDWWRRVIDALNVLLYCLRFENNTLHVISCRRRLIDSRCWLSEIVVAALEEAQFSTSRRQLFARVSLYTEWAEKKKFVVSTGKLQRRVQRPWRKDISSFRLVETHFSRVISGVIPRFGSIRLGRDWLKLSAVVLPRNRKKFQLCRRAVTAVTFERIENHAIAVRV